MPKKRTKTAAKKAAKKKESVSKRKPAGAKKKAAGKKKTAKAKTQVKGKAKKVAKTVKSAASYVASLLLGRRGRLRRNVLGCFPWFPVLVHGEQCLTDVSRAGSFRPYLP